MERTNESPSEDREVKGELLVDQCRDGQATLKKMGGLNWYKVAQTGPMKKSERGLYPAMGRKRLKKRVTQQEYLQVKPVRERTSNIIHTQFCPVCYSPIYNVFN